MTDLVRTFDSLMGETSKIEGFNSLTELKVFFEEIDGQTTDLQESAEIKLVILRETLTKLKSTMGLRDKLLGGRLGGNKGKAANSKELTQSIETADGLIDNIATFSETFYDDVMNHAISIIAVDDEEFSQTVAYQELMTEAVSFTEEVLREIDEALDALSEAADAEEWDMVTDSGYAEMDSDMANMDAADEVQDVTNILATYRDFLANIGEAANTTELDGSDFDFSWSDMMTEDFFGDFWGSSEMLDKIARGQNDMSELRNKIIQLFKSFGNSCDQANNEIDERLNAEWDNA